MSVSRSIRGSRGARFLITVPFSLLRGSCDHRAPRGSHRLRSGALARLARLVDLGHRHVYFLISIRNRLIVATQWL